MKNIKFKRITAYLIDFLIVLVLISLLSEINFLNPNKGSYDEALEEYNEIYEQYNNSIQNISENTTQEEYEQIINSKELVSSYYNVVKNSTSVTLIYIFTIVLYYSLFPYFFNGQTIGKKLLKINISLDNDKRIPIYKLILKSLFLPFYSGVIFRTAFSELLMLIYVLIFKEKFFAEVYAAIIIIDIIWGYVDILCLLKSKENKSIHDKILKTKVEFIKNN